METSVQQAVTVTAILQLVVVVLTVTVAIPIQIQLGQAILSTAFRPSFETMLYLCASRHFVASATSEASMTQVVAVVVAVVVTQEEALTMASDVMGSVPGVVGRRHTAARQGRSVRVSRKMTCRDTSYSLSSVFVPPSVRTTARRQRQQLVRAG